MADIPQERKASKSHRIEKTIDVDCPVSTCYNQWTQFESWPNFMEGIESCEQVDDTHLHFVGDIGGKKVEWDAQIVAQEPDRQISWNSTSGKVNNGAVHFLPNGQNQCRINLVMSYEPEGFVEKTGDVLGVVSRRVEGDLKRFKEYIEKRQVETGAWRGEVKGGTVQNRPTSGQSREGHRIPGQTVNTPTTPTNPSTGQQYGGPGSTSGKNRPL